MLWSSMHAVTVLLRICTLYVGFQPRAVEGMCSKACAYKAVVTGRKRE